VFEDWWHSYEDIEQVIEEFLDLGGGVAFVVGVMRGQLSGSGGFLEQRYGSVTVWEDGLVECVRIYGDLDEARAAAERLAEERGKAVSEVVVTKQQQNLHGTTTS
jgi:ketosteroid isomerase-like protein